MLIMATDQALGFPKALQRGETVDEVLMSDDDKVGPVGGLMPRGRLIGCDTCG